MQTIIVDGKVLQLVIRVKETYGTTRYYPVNVAAQLFCELVEQKTLTERELQLAQKLGFNIVYTAQEPTPPVEG